MRMSWRSCAAPTCRFAGGLRLLVVAVAVVTVFAWSVVRRGGCGEGKGVEGC